MREGDHRIQPDHAESPAAVAGQAVRPDSTTLDVGLFPYINVVENESCLPAQLIPPDPSHAR